MRISASLVLYEHTSADFHEAVDSYLKSCEGVLHIVDNSATPIRSEWFAHERVRYHFAGANLGFGRGHNLALHRLKEPSDCHLFLNPDVWFSPEVLPHLAQQLDANPGWGAIMPRIEYPDGQLQRLCKLLPTPVDLIFRRFLPFKLIQQLINQRYELHTLAQDRRNDVPSLSGCFLLVRTSLLKKIGGFDERFFMYMEDVDLVRRIGMQARTIYDPSVKITHAYAKGSYSNKRLLRYHLESAIKYFNKWGWLFDSHRKLKNQDVLRRL